MSHRPADDERVYFLGTDGKLRGIPASELFDSQNGAEPSCFMFSSILSPAEARPENGQQGLEVLQRLLGREGKQ